MNPQSAAAQAQAAAQNSSAGISGLLVAGRIAFLALLVLFVLALIALLRRDSSSGDS